LPFLQEYELRLAQAELIPSTSAQITLYFKPERAEPPESNQPSQPSEGGAEVFHWSSSKAVEGML